MSKLPSFAFYPGDWLKDPQLRMASLASRAIWFDLICAMWEAPERGAIEGTPAQFCKLAGCSADEFSLFLSEAKSLRFANVRQVSAEAEGAIRVECRRVLREEKQRQVWAKQKSRQRGRIESGAKSADCPPNVREVSAQSPASLSSSSSSSRKRERVSKAEKQNPDRYRDWLRSVLIPAFPIAGRCQEASALRHLRKTRPSESELTAFITQLESWKPSWAESGFQPGLHTFLSEGKYRAAPMPLLTNGSRKPRALPTSQEYWARTA